MYNIMYMQTKKQVSCGYQDEIELVGTIFLCFILNVMVNMIGKHGKYEMLGI